MVITAENEMISHGEVESSLPEQDPHPKPHTFGFLGRQSSIYSLTLDEFQHTLWDSGKHFGSMNMDEFLTSIWTAEENQAATATNHNSNIQAVNSSHQELFGDERGIARQASLSRQGSLTLPPPLCRKTVDEVWSEIHRGHGQKNGGGGDGGGGIGRSSGGNVGNSEGPARQPTFGEMTLEDFLVKAGVVREGGNIVPPAAAVPRQQLQQQRYGLFQGNAISSGVGAGFVSRPLLGMATGGGSFQTMGQGAGAMRMYAPPPPPPPPPPPAAVGICGGRVDNGGGGCVAGGGFGMVGPVSPVSPDGTMGSLDNAGNQIGMNAGLRGRKRIIDGLVEKVVERRQRRMIKNRESAARSRARKQAYTVELEAELNQLKEENRQLKHALTELERKIKQQYFEEMRIKNPTKAHKAKEKLMLMRRSSSCPM